MRPGIELEGKRVLVVGLARTGVATALFCAARGARVTATEERGAAANSAKLRSSFATPVARSNSAVTRRNTFWRRT